MRHRKMIALTASVAAVVAAGLVVAVLSVRHEPASAGPGAAAAPSPGAAPAGAAVAVRLLLSAGGRSALTPELNAVLPAGQLFPEGTTFTAAPGGWHRAGAYANLAGTLHEPGHLARRAEIGLVYRHGRWLVTFETAA
jgi:hypothetical protein